MSDEEFEAQPFKGPRLPGGKIDLNMRELILARYIEGRNKTEIAQEFQVSTGAVRNIINSEERIEKIKKNKVDYNAAERFKVLNKAFAQIESMIERCSDEFRLKALIDGLNVLIHTRRIEEGLSGATPQATAPFTFQFNVTERMKEIVAKDDLPELGAGDATIDVNPLAHDVEPEPLDTTPEAPNKDNFV